MRASEHVGHLLVKVIVRDWHICQVRMVEALAWATAAATSSLHEGSDQ